MRCKADIHVGQVDDTLFVPIQAIFRNGPVTFVYVPSGSGYAERRITLGQASELFVQINDGLSDGDIVLLREPGPGEVVARIDKETAGVQRAAMEARQRSPSGNSYAGQREGMRSSGPPQGMRGRRPEGMRGRRPDSTGGGGEHTDAAAHETAEGSEGRAYSNGGDAAAGEEAKPPQDS